MEKSAGDRNSKILATPSKYTRELAEFVARASFDDLPQAAIQAAKKCILDVIGVALMGSSAEWAREVRDFTVGFEGMPQASLIGFGDRVSCLSAAYVNGILSKIDDLDDGHRLLGMCHPGPTVVPGSLAVGEWLAKSGREIITAVVMGYEVAIRVGAAMDVSHRMKLEANNPNATCGIMGVVAAVSNLLGLDADRILTAWSIAACDMPRAVNLDDEHISSLRTELIGSTSRTGVHAALMARDLSLVGSGLTFEGKDGYCTQMSGVCKEEKLVEGLGVDYYICSVYFKPYPSCRYTHSAITALIELMENHQLKASHIDKILVRVGKAGSTFKGTSLLPVSVPLHELQTSAKFNIPYLIATTLINGRLWVEHFEKKALTDAEVTSLMERIKVMHEPKYDVMFLKMPALVRVETVDGRVYTSEVDYPKGEPENPLSEEELREKFHSLASRVLRTDKIAVVEKSVDQLEELQDIRELLGNLVGGRGTPGNCSDER